MAPPIIASLLLLILMTSYARSAPAKKVYNVPYLEEQARGTEIFNLMRHVDQSLRSTATFRLLSQQLISGSDVVSKDIKWVELNDRTGVLSVKRPVDREVDCGEDDTHDCVIRVSIIQYPQQSIVSITVNLAITDINDHYPVFPQDPIVVNISETAPIDSRISLDKFIATDLDMGDHSRITYSLTRNQYFGLDSKEDETGAPRLDLVLLDDLDHERSSIEELILTALDGGQPIKSQTARLVVNIQDANDNSPVFTKPVTVISLQESLAVGDVITTVTAHDVDSGRFGQVRYFVPKGGNSAVGRRLVRVDPRSGRVFLNQPLNHAKHNNIRIAIGARDLGEKSRVGKTVLEIKVIDVNDNSPEVRIDFIVTSQGDTAYVPESAEVGFYVAQVVVSDADKGVNGHVVTEVSTRPVMTSSKDEAARLGAPVSGYFELSEEGYVKTTKKLDREDIPGFLVEVSACDSATPRRCTSKNFTIQLLDVNDNYPVFHDVTRQELKESTPIGSRVAQVTATDRDQVFQPALRMEGNDRVVPSTNGVIVYLLEGGKGVFVIDKKTGDIKLAGKLDFETKAQWKLTVVARDEGPSPKSTRTDVIVDVINVNDNSPVFVSPSVTNSTIYATIKSEEAITVLKAKDADKDRLRFSIVLENGKKPKSGGKFIVEARTGTLRLNFSNPNIEDMLGDHKLTLKVQDQGVPPSSSMTTLNVRVTNLPLHQIISMQKRLDSSDKLAASNLTVVLIASLAAAAVLLVIILTGVVVKCKRENKEIRTYNCRNAETRKGWQLGASQGTLTNDIMVASPKHIMASRDSNLNSLGWNPTPARRLSCDTKEQLLGSGISRSTSQIYHQHTLERKMTSFSKPTRSESAHPLTPQIDGDSGRGDSDHDTGSCEDKDALQQQQADQHQVQPVVVSYHNEPSDVQVMEVNASNGEMGPLCTSSCLEYGHSDKCWMNVYDAQSEDYPDSRRCNTPSYAYQQIVNSSPMTPCGLETICETQPLHSVLGTDEEAEESYLAESSYLNRSQTVPGAYMYQQEQDQMYPNTYTIPYTHHQHHNNEVLPHSSNYETIYMSQQQYPQQLQQSYTAPDYRHSASDLFHDGLNQQQPPSFYPKFSPTKSIPRCSSPSSKSDCASSSKRRSTASLHGELLHRRFLAVAQGNDAMTSRGDDVALMTSRAEAARSMTPSQYGQVSMQETQQIIDDIDQLIEH